MISKKALLAVPLTATLILSACGNDDSDKPAKLDNDSNKNEKVDTNKNKAKEDYIKKKARKPEDIEKDEKSKDVKGAKTVSLDDAIKSLEDINEFIVTDDEWFANVVKDYNKKGIMLDGDFSKPYKDNAAPANARQDYVFVGIIDNKDVKKKGNDEATVKYKVKAGLVSDIGDDDIEAEGEDAQSEMREGDQGESYDLTYHIKKKDGKWNVTRDVPSKWTDSDS